MRTQFHSSAIVIVTAVFAARGICSAQTLKPVAPTHAALGAVAGNGTTITGFGFNGTLSGFPTGAVTMTGGGAYDPQTASDTVPTDTFVNSAGTFRCTADVAQGPLSGCLEGQGVRWDTAQLLASTGFKCTGAAGEAAKTASTDGQTVVLLGDFYRAGDGIDESFADVKMIISNHDIAPDIPGLQNIWIQGVGCGSSIAHFSH